MRLPAHLYDFRQDQAWAQDLAATFPTSWQATMLRRWESRWRDDRAGANRAHLHACGRLKQAERAGLRADATLAELRDEADKSARDAVRRIEHADLMARRGTGIVAAPLLMTAQLWALEDWMNARGLGDAWARLAALSQSGRALLARIVCPRTWRRVLKGMHAKAVEATARGLGLVHKRAGLYVSDDALKRRQAEKAHCTRVLESVVAVNDSGQEWTLAELSAKGTSNAAIRRQELMTRIAGFELIAKQCGHEAYFLTVTCPSRMHAWRTEGGVKVGPNPRHDGTSPIEANRYLGKQWNACMEHCRRWGVDLYGFRIAEPNHDGTPHWHCLLFMPAEVGRGTVKNNPRTGQPVAGRVLLRAMRRYFLHNTDASERGAKKHRVKVERIDWTKGSAAGYIAKYVSKNIDGYSVEKDLYGNDTLHSSKRVEAWASTWRIRQFQQVGGAPVGVWRELRRLHPEQAAGGVLVGMAVEAVNLAKLAPPDASEKLQQHTAATAWAAYTELQGGWRVPRRLLRVKLLKEQTGELGRYGEPVPPRALGVLTVDPRPERVVQPFGIVMHPMTLHPRRVVVESESERAAWTIVDGAREQDAAGEWRARAGAAARLAAAKARALPRGEAARPWSPVTNSTRPAVEPAAPMFGPSVERKPKRGRWHNWNGGVHTMRQSNDPPDPHADHHAHQHRGN